MINRMYSVGKCIPIPTKRLGVFAPKPLTSSEFKDAFLSTTDEKKHAVVTVFQDLEDAKQYMHKVVTDKNNVSGSKLIQYSAPIFTLKADLTDCTEAQIEGVELKSAPLSILNEKVLEKVAVNFAGVETKLQSSAVQKYDHCFDATAGGFNAKAIATLLEYIGHRKIAGTKKTFKEPKNAVLAKELIVDLSKESIRDKQTILHRLKRELYKDGVPSSKQYKPLLDLLIANLVVLNQPLVIAPIHRADSTTALRLL